MEHLFKNFHVSTDGQGRLDDAIGDFQRFQGDLFSYELDAITRAIVKSKLDNIFYYVKRTLSQNYPGVPTPKVLPPIERMIQVMNKPKGEKMKKKTKKKAVKKPMPKPMAR